MAYIGIKPSDVAGAGQANITGSLTAGSATVTDDLIVDTNTLYVDSANNRVGIGTSSPANELEVVGDIRVTAPSTGTTAKIGFENASGSTPAWIGIDGNQSNSLSFHVASNIGPTTNFERLRIDNNGTVTKPAQPSFMVIKSGDQTLTVGSNTTVTWQNETWDVGGNFASNTFTAPVTGKYYLHTQMRIDNLDTAAGYYLLAINTSNRTKYVIVDPNFTADLSYYSMSMNSVFDMDAGDTAFVYANQNSGTASHIEDNAAYTSFSGYLLG